MSTIKILLADDAASVREALRAVLEMDAAFEVIDEAADGEEALRKTLSLRPDVVLMDVSMPKMDGLEATFKIRSAVSDVGVVLVTFHDISDSQLDSCGADGYVQKGSPPDELYTAIRGARLAVLFHTKLAGLSASWKKILAWLVVKQKLSVEQVEEMADGQGLVGRPIVNELTKKYISEDELARAIADVNNLPRVVLTPYLVASDTGSNGSEASTCGRKFDIVQPKVARRISATYAADRCVVPVAIIDDEIILAMADPTDTQTTAAIEAALQLRVRPIVSTPSEIQDAIQRAFYRMATSSILSSLLARYTSS